MYPKHAVDMFAGISPVVDYNHDYNDKMLSGIERPIGKVTATDDILQKIHLSNKQIDTIKERNIGDKWNLADVLRIKLDVLTMLTSNINIEDRLINRLVGKILSIGDENGAVKVIHVKFNDQNAGLLTMWSNIIARQNHWLPIKKCEVSFPVKKSAAFNKKESIYISFVLGMYSTRISRTKFKRICYKFWDRKAS